MTTLSTTKLRPTARLGAAGGNQHELNGIVVRHIEERLAGGVAGEEAVGNRVVKIKVTAAQIDGHGLSRGVWVVIQICRMGIGPIKIGGQQVQLQNLFDIRGPDH